MRQIKVKNNFKCTSDRGTNANREMKPFPVERTHHAKKKRHARLKESRRFFASEILLGCEELENEVRKLSSLKRNSRKRKRSRTITISTSSSVCSSASNPPSILSKENPKKYVPKSQNKDDRKKLRSSKKTDREETETERRSGIDGNSLTNKLTISREEKIEKCRKGEKDEIWTIKSTLKEDCAARITKFGMSVEEASSVEEEKNKEMVHQTLAAKWSLILRDGLLDGVRNELASEYSLVPSYECLKAPGLNMDLKAILSKKRLQADQRECSLQNQLSFTLVAIEEILASLLSGNEESRLMARTIDTLIDVGLMLADAHHSFSVKRRTNVISAFDIGDIADLSRVESFLFGERFLNVLKSARLLVEGKDCKVEAEGDGKMKRPETSDQKTSVAPKDRGDEKKECGKIRKEPGTDEKKVTNDRKKDVSGEKVTGDETKVINDKKEVTDDGKKVTNGEKVTSDGTKVTNGKKEVTDDDGKKVANGEKVTGDKTKVTNGKKEVTDDGKKVANGEKVTGDKTKVTNSEKEVTNGEGKVTKDEKKITGDEEKGTNDEKNAKHTDSNHVKKSEGKSEKWVEESEKRKIDIAKKSGEKGDKIVRNCKENATRKDKNSGETKDDKKGCVEERKNEKESCDDRPKNDEKDSSSKDPSEKIKDLPEKDKVPMGKAKDPAEKDKVPAGKAKDPAEKGKVPAGKAKDPAENGNDPVDEESKVKHNNGNKNIDIQKACPDPKSSFNVTENISKEFQHDGKIEVKFKTKHETAEDLLLNLKNVSLRIIDEITAVYQKRIDALQPEDNKFKPETKVAKESAGMKPFPGIREALRGAYTAQGHSEVAAETMLYSLAPSTMKVYERPIRFWWDFCTKRKINVYEGTVRDVIQFFVDHENVISSHNVLATWRSALGEFTIEDLGKSKCIANYVKGFTCVKAGKHDAKYQRKNNF